MIVRVIDITTNNKVFSDSRRDSEIATCMFLPRVGDVLNFQHGVGVDYRGELRVVNVKIIYEWTWNLLKLRDEDIVEIYVEPITK